MKCSYIFKIIFIMNKIFRVCFKIIIEEFVCYSIKLIYLLDFVCLIYYCSRFFKKMLMIKEN